MYSHIPVNPTVLRWARETAGFSLENAAEKLGRKSINADIIAAWERGDGAPSYAQLEALAYDIYKRPMALFFFPEPPYEETPRQAFRTLPEHEIKLLSPRMHHLLRQAKTMQLNLAELFEGKNPSSRQIICDLRLSTSMNISEIASLVRQYLNVDLKEQCSWKNAEEAFKKWRILFEECGLFIFKDAFKEDSYSGFCIYDDQFPIIYVNNSKPYTRQIFTLFHELPHLLFKTGGIDKRLEDYIDLLNNTDKRIEIFCNSFAGSFLVPDEDFDRRINNMVINDRMLSDLATSYCVSREVILRKLYDRRMVSNKLYEQIVDEWEKRKVNRGSGGDYYLTKKAYLGEFYIETAFSRLYQNRISISQLAEYLGVREKNVPGMEEVLYIRGGGA